MRRFSWCALLAVVLAAQPVGVGAQSTDGAWVTALPAKTNTFLSVDLFGDGVGYAIDSQEPLLYKTVDFGASWVPALPPSGASQYHVDFADAEIGYARQGASMWRTDNGAITWSTLKPPQTVRSDLDQSSFLIEELHAISGTDEVFIAGDFFNVKHDCPLPMQKMSLFRGAADGGWVRTRLPIRAWPHEIEFLDGDRGVLLLQEYKLIEERACGWTYESQNSFVYLTEDGGTTFREVYRTYWSENDQEAITAVAMPAPGRVLLGTHTGRILLTTDGGRRWKTITQIGNAAFEAVGTQTGSIDVIDFGTRLVGYAGTNGVGIWRTVDGGLTWSRESSPYEAPGMVFGDIAAVGAHDALAAGPGSFARRISTD